MEPMERLALSRGNARQFTKLLLSLLSHIGKMVGCLGIAPSSRQLRAGTSLSKFATQANAKAELNRRSQACEGPGRHRYSRRRKWTGMRVTLPLLRCGRSLQTATTCVYKHLCPRKWNPVLESHQPLRFCKPPLELLGQRDGN